MHMSHREIYVIFSLGRTGSHMILETISSGGHAPGGLCDAASVWYPKDALPPDARHVAIHTHDLHGALRDLRMDKRAVTLILSRRRDIFAQAMSQLVAELSNEWHGRQYSDRPIAPCVVPMDQFKRRIVPLKYAHLTAYAVAVREYKKVVTIFYEDLVLGGAAHVAHSLGIEHDPARAGKVHSKSTRSYKDCVLNWSELWDEFQRDS
jgi:LPS sulfotransferase NodH